MKILSKKKQNGILVMLASILVCAQNGNVDIYLEEICTLIFDITRELGGDVALFELGAMLKAIDRQNAIASDIQNIKLRATARKDNNDGGLLN